MQLAIETTGHAGSVAVLQGSEVLIHRNLQSGQRTAATLTPEIETLLQWCRQRDLWPNLISIASGPGSFTGLRIGITTAKTLAYALALPVVGVDSLAAIAAAVLHEHPQCESVLVGVDAYRQQTYAGRFARADLLPPVAAVPQHWSACPDSVRVAAAEEWQAELADRPPAMQIAGDAKPMGDDAQRLLHRRCDAIGVGLLGLRAAVAGRLDDPMQLLPRYLKPSAAEEKAATSRLASEP